MIAVVSISEIYFLRKVIHMRKLLLTNIKSRNLFSVVIQRFGITHYSSATANLTYIITDSPT